MKKLMALIALVTMVAVSSVAYAETTTINATVTGMRSITGCTGGNSVSLTGLVPTLGATDTCTVLYANSYATGYAITYGSPVATTLASIIQSDAIEALVPSTPTATFCGATDGVAALANKAVPEDCWSYSLTIPVGNTATAASDALQGAGVNFDSGEHAVTVAGEEVLSDTVVYDGSVDFVFEAQVSTTTEAGTDYTRATSVTIGA